MINLFQPLAHLVAKMKIDGKDYDIEQFKVDFVQPTDYKGQPQHEIKGGRLYVAMTQGADDNLYNWAKASTKLKDGVILFQTDLGMTVLEISFMNAYCINLSRKVNAMTGTVTSMVIAPEEVYLNGVRHDNYWVR